MVRAIGYAVSLGFNEEKYSAVNPWLGRVLVARLDATLGAIRGISEGVAVQRERGAVQFVQFVQLLCSQQMA